MVGLFRSSYRLLRYLIVLTFWAVFLWQSAISLDKYLSRNTTFIRKTVQKREQTFPGVSFCDSGHIIQNDTDGDTNLVDDNIMFADEIDALNISFGISYSHNDEGNNIV